jgi:hypothetical protein
LVIRSLDKLKRKRSEISGRDLQKPFGEFKNRNSLQDDKYLVTSIEISTKDILTQAAGGDTRVE